MTDLQSLIARVETELDALPFDGDGRVSEGALRGYTRQAALSFLHWEAKQKEADERTAATGWVKSWDGWEYCPSCAAAIRAKGYRLNETPSEPVEDDAVCGECRTTLRALAATAPAPKGE